MGNLEMVDSFWHSWNEKVYKITLNMVLEVAGHACQRCLMSLIT